jgi:Cu/Ag efflux protein CusF
MKKLAFVLSFVLAAGVAFAKQAETKPATKSPAAATKPAGKTHEVPAEIVSVDATAKTVTIKSEPANKTLPVDEKAVTSLKDLKAGQKVTLLCRDNDKGEHVAVAGVKAEAKTAAPSSTEKKPPTPEKNPSAPQKK